MEQLGTCDSTVHEGSFSLWHHTGLHERSASCIKWSAVPAPAEYTCPRCGSNVSTHICMKAEPVAGETKNCAYCQAELPLIPNIHYSPLSGAYLRCAAPAVAAPAEGENNKGESTRGQSKGRQGEGVT